MASILNWQKIEKVLVAALVVALFFSPLNLIPEFGTWNFWQLLALVVLTILFAIFGVQKSCSAKMGAWLIGPIFILLVYLPVAATRTAHASNFFQLSTLGIAAVGLPVINRAAAKYGRSLILSLIVCLTSLYAIWGIAQFGLQHNLGLTPIGEVLSGSAIPGIAKFSTSLPGLEKLVRAYGPFSHSNVLSGVLMIGLVSATRALARGKKAFIYPAFIIFVAIILTFSRAGYISMVLLAIIFALNHEKPPWKLKRMTLLTLITTTLLVFMPLIMFRVTDNQDRGISARISAAKAASHLFIFSPFGIGAGTYPARLEQYLIANRIPYQQWEVEPLHSAPALLLLELGWLPTLVIVWLAVYWGTRKYYRTWLWLLPLLPLLLFDHYFYSQATALIWLAVLLAALAEEPAPLMPAKQSISE